MHCSKQHCCIRAHEQTQDMGNAALCLEQAHTHDLRTHLMFEWTFGHFSTSCRTCITPEQAVSNAWTAWSTLTLAHCPTALLDSITVAAQPGMQLKQALHECASTVPSFCYMRCNFRWLFLWCFVVGCLLTLSA